ncbi:hypothetical protein PNH38_11800 [Anoxybacillus rupiensis]|jgi:hypothetical protein|uniref:Uncharacterized protein n=1 Tax=Anoxybacteroides rupiense TaxID=311460 RepID=A0ABT5W5H3_9BACL|nr:hypothetical protein [Anoxybacillus rupiensis]MDE8564554.1 hypothetical protein [Anoxybacillus rupiensis]
MGQCFRKEEDDAYVKCGWCIRKNDKQMEDFKELVIFWGLEPLFTVGVKFKNGLYLGVSLYGHEDFPDCYAVGLNEANDEFRWFF